MRRALVLFGNAVEVKNLAESANYLEKELGFKVDPLCVQDFTREKFALAEDGGRGHLVAQTWEEVEKEIEKAEVDRVKAALKEVGVKDELIVETGDISEIVTEYMKKCDLLVIGKNNILTGKEIEILKGNYKSLLLIGEKPLKAIKNVVIGNDNGVKVSRSCYHFINIFPEVETFSSFTINKEMKKNTVVEYLEEHGKKIVHEELETNNYEDVLKRVDEADLFIMGNLSRSYFFEKIVGKNGIKLLEKGKAPIFIG